MGRTTLRALTMPCLALWLAMLSLSSCSSPPAVVVGSKNFTEQVILGEIIAAQVERRLHIPVDRKLNLGGTLLAHEGLVSGAIDLYPEYSGTALTEIFHQPAQKDAQAAFRAVADNYGKLGIAWLQPLGFNDTFAMVVRTDVARREHLRSLSDAARLPWKIGVGYEFTQRPDGLDGLVQTYGLRLDGSPVVMDLGLLYAALKLDQVGLVAANATDGMLGHTEFTQLGDARHYFPPYVCAIAAREESLKKFPGLKKALDELSGRITDAAMRRLNEQVDVEHRSAAEVAHEFLETWKRASAVSSSIRSSSARDRRARRWQWIWPRQAGRSPSSNAIRSAAPASTPAAFPPRPSSPTRAQRTWCARPATTASTSTPSAST